MLGPFTPSKIRSIWEIWSEKKNAEHFDQIVHSGEKDRQIFAQIDQSDLISEKERNHCDALTAAVTVYDKPKQHIFWAYIAIQSISKPSKLVMLLAKVNNMICYFWWDQPNLFSE